MLRFRTFILREDALPSYGRMSGAEFLKVNSQTGEPRIDVLRKAMKDGIEIPTINGIMIKVLNSPENQKAVDRLEKSETNRETLKTNTGEIVSSEIGKSRIFGGAGVGGGRTGDTKKAESLQCLYCAAMTATGKVEPFEYYNQERLQKASSRALLDGATFESMMELDPSWHYSGYWTAKTLINKGYIDNTMKFHRGDKVMKSIYTAKDTAVRNSGLAKFTDDKWNPGDIWAVKTGYVPSRDLPTGSIQELNDALVKHLNEKKLIGISLKKLASDTGIKCEILNVESDTEVHSFNSASLMTTFARMGSNFWRNQSGTIVFDRDSGMTVRTSTNLAAPIVELKLKTARGGSGGWNEITNSFKNRLSLSIPNNDTLKRESKDLNTKGSSSRFAMKYYNLARKVHSNLDKDQFMEGLVSSSQAKVHSKLAAIIVTAALVSNKRSGKSDLVITDLVNYAGSKSDISSAYLKVYQ